MNLKYMKVSLFEISCKKKWTFTIQFFLDVPVDVDEFVSSSEQVWRNVAVHTLHTNGSSVVKGCRQN